MPQKVIVDTGFLISLGLEKRDNHLAAKAYWKHFKETGMLVYLSTIVVAEFEIVDPIDDEIRLSCIPVNFNWPDARLAAKFERFRDRAKEKEEKASRVAVRDDIKIIAQAANLEVDYVITDDHDTFERYYTRLRDESLVNFKILVLRDGFDIGHFRAGGRDLLTPQGI